MARFPPEPSVVRRVKLTRTAYAQLLGQRFHPPKIFGVWREREGSPEWRWRDVGMKIVRIYPVTFVCTLIISPQACGFEMLYQESKSRTDLINVDLQSSVRVCVDFDNGCLPEPSIRQAEARREGLRHNPDYAQYIRDLVSVNYFRGEREGSQAWRTLEGKAADLFLEVRRAE